MACSHEQDCIHVEMVVWLKVPGSQGSRAHLDTHSLSRKLCAGFGMLQETPHVAHWRNQEDAMPPAFESLAAIRKRHNPPYWGAVQLSERLGRQRQPVVRLIEFNLHLNCKLQVQV